MLLKFEVSEKWKLNCLLWSFNSEKKENNKIISCIPCRLEKDSKKMLKVTSKGVVSHFTLVNERLAYPFIDSWCHIDFFRGYKDPCDENFGRVYTRILYDNVFMCPTRNPVDLNLVSMDASLKVHRVQFTVRDIWTAVLKCVEPPSCETRMSIYVASRTNCNTPRSISSWKTVHCASPFSQSAATVDAASFH